MSSAWLGLRQLRCGDCCFLGFRGLGLGVYVWEQGLRVQGFGFIVFERVQ